ncbi:MAG: hypothetical protein CSA70_06275 [Rhodobacterales bacterium]|nr:MAG: hypothetical protein CSA70_06275 [Rhodobacterales bacterium]
MQKFLILASLTLLVGCGGGGYRSFERDSSPAPARSTALPRASASGPISRACLASDRKARSPALCGCIQHVANQSLSASDQRLAATFYGDPHKAQEIRQSDRVSHEVFWKKYKSYSQQAAQTCG